MIQKVQTETIERCLQGSDGKTESHRKKRILQDKSQDVKDSEPSKTKFSKREYTSFPEAREMYLGSDATLLHSQSLRYCNTGTKLNFLETFEESEEILFSKAAVD